MKSSAIRSILHRKPSALNPISLLLPKGPSAFLQSPVLLRTDLRHATSRPTLPTTPASPAFKSSSPSLDQVLRNLPETRVSTLKNSLRVASDDLGNSTATVGLWIDAGSRYESEKTNGALNFLEHLIFKGTSRQSGQEIEREVESKGAQLNAYTSREQTAIYAKCLSKDVPWAVQLLSEIVLNRSFKDEEIERQRGVILREMETLELNFKDVVFDYLHQTAFQGTPLARSIYGPSSNVRSLSKNDLLEQMEYHYKAPRMVLVGAGGVHHQELCALAEKHLAGLPAHYSHSPPTNPVIAPCRYTGSDLRHRDDDIPLAHIALAVKGCSWTHADMVPLSVAASMIGQWEMGSGGLDDNHSSRLASIFGHFENGAQSFQAFNTSYTDTGLWGIFYTADRFRLMTTTKVIINEWKRLCTSITDFQVERGKNLLKTQLLQQLDGTTPLCDEIGRQVLRYGRRIPVHEMLARIDLVDSNAVRNVCLNYIYDRDPVYASIGPVEDLNEYVNIRNDMYWLRF